MLEVEKLKKEFPKIEDQKKVKTEFQKMKDKNQQDKDNCRSAEAGLKTREEQLEAVDKLHATELVRQQKLLDTEENRVFKASAKWAEAEANHRKEKEEL